MLSLTWRPRTASCAISGFTLIELMIGIAILGIALALAMPSYSQWIQNTHIRNTAESIVHGMQRARAEAVSRNTAVAFTLTPGGGLFWRIVQTNDDTVIESRTAGEISLNVTLTASPVPVDPDIPTTMLTFSNLGNVVANANGSDSITQIDVDSSSLAAEDSRDLRIVVGVGGIVRMCDPNVSSESDPRYC